MLNIEEEFFVVLQHFMYSGFDNILSVFIVKSDTHLRVCASNVCQ